MAWNTIPKSDLEALAALCKTQGGQPVFLPDEAYLHRKDGPPIVRINAGGTLLALHRVLYDMLNPDDKLGKDMLLRPPGQDGRNVNPLAMVRTRGKYRKLSPRCVNGHEYAKVGERPEGSVTRCQACYEADLAKRRKPGAGPSVGEINRAKTHCPAGHEYTEENTLYRRTDRGRRRCRECERTRMHHRRMTLT